MFYSQCFCLPPKALLQGLAWALTPQFALCREGGARVQTGPAYLCFLTSQSQGSLMPSLTLHVLGFPLQGVILGSRGCAGASACLQCSRNPVSEDMRGKGHWCSSRQMLVYQLPSCQMLSRAVSRTFPGGWSLCMPATTGSLLYSHLLILACEETGTYLDCLLNLPSWVPGSCGRTQRVLTSMSLSPLCSASLFLERTPARAIAMCPSEGSMCGGGA